MKRVTGLAVLLASVLGAAVTLSAQTAVKEKSPLYTYVSNWGIARAHFDEMPKARAADEPILQKALADGLLVGYGNDQVILHQADGLTHDDWWSAKSLAGLLKTLDAFFKAGNATISVYDTANKHWDEIEVSRYYNWKPGSYHDAYAHASDYTLKADAPPDAVDTLSKSLIVPVMEKLLAAGAICEYEVDTEAEHTSNPNGFTVFYVCTNAECLDTTNAALQSWIQEHPLDMAAVNSMVDMSSHRDLLFRANATWK